MSLCPPPNFRLIPAIRRIRPIRLLGHNNFISRRFLQQQNQRNYQQRPLFRRYLTSGLAKAQTPPVKAAPAKAASARAASARATPTKAAPPTDDEQTAADNEDAPRGKGHRSFLLPFSVMTLLYLHQKLSDYTLGTPAEEITAQDFFAKILPNGNVARVEVVGRNTVRVTTAAGPPATAATTTGATAAATTSTPASPPRSFVFRISSPEAFETKLEAAQTRLGVPPDKLLPVILTQPAWWSSSNSSSLLAAAAGALLFALLLRGRAAGSSSDPMRALRVGRANPATLKDLRQAVTFADVAGMHDAKLEVMEFVDFLRQPEKYARLGAQVPKGALLVGPPGTGKTLLARAVAGEAGVPFFSMSGSDFMEVFVGVGPSRVRDLFSQARRSSPSIVFIDEIDAVGRRRQKGGVGGGAAHDERESTLNQLLVELDGFVPGTNVVVLAGTNRPDVLDPALTRPGRFDRTVAIEKPDLREREEIFETHMKPLLLSEAVRADQLRRRLAALTPGFSGADIHNVCNEAAIYAARRGAAAVEVLDFERACERVLGGIERTSSILTPQVRDTVAYHEAGHAVCGWFLKGADPIVKVSIVPRMNGALGFAQNLPEEVQLIPKEKICDRIGVLLGGRVAEELTQYTSTTGAHDDLSKATRLAYAYTSSWGFNERLGLRSFAPGGDESGGSSSHQLYRPYSDDLARVIDEEAGSLLTRQYERVKALLSSKLDLLKTLAATLKEKETLTYSDLVEILGKRPFPLGEDYQRYIEAIPQLLPPPADPSSETLCPV